MPENSTENHPLNQDSRQLLQRARQTYQIPAWSDGYVDINPRGQLVVYPNGVTPARATGVVLADVLARLQHSGLQAPVLVRFPEILEHRVQTLTHAFTRAIAAHHYRGRYTPVYPIKVNQQRRVVETLAHAHPNAGLEAGSKPELMAVMALTDSPNRTIVCNGYKDDDTIKLALIAQQCGYHVIIIIEKISELQRVHRVARTLGVTPCLGLRLRLAAISKGKWQNSGGQKSKFGLTAMQCLQCIDYCKQHQLLASLQVLHVHLGSQVANIRDIQAGLAECARFYAQIHALGAPITTIDVGGGLAVDYQGNHSRNPYSMNYTLEEYASKVVHAFSECCEQHALPHPNIITESGRMMTAHHAILLVDLIDQERMAGHTPPTPPAADAPPLLQDLFNDYQTCTADNAVEYYHDARYALEQCHSSFTHGVLSLAERASIEQCYAALVQRIRQQLSPHIKSHQSILETLNAELATRLYGNFSIFQSLPDIWAIQQIFPICPIAHLDKPLTQHAVLHDITCDSDGRIDTYINGQDLQSTLLLPEVPDTETEDGAPDAMILGIFLTGAYQEILGDMHNLFGDTHTVHVLQSNTDPQGFTLVEPVAGETVADVLHNVQFDAAQLQTRYGEKLAQAPSLTEAEKQSYRDYLSASLAGYTYLAPS